MTKTIPSKECVDYLRTCDNERLGSVMEVVSDCLLHYHINHDLKAEYMIAACEEAAFRLRNGIFVLP